jgi:hypothetical protein
MTNNPNLSPARRTEVFRIGADDAPAACSAARRIKPIHQPFQSVGERAISRWFHSLTEFNKKRMNDEDAGEQ